MDDFRRMKARIGQKELGRGMGCLWISRLLVHKRRISPERFSRKEQPPTLSLEVISGPRQDEYDSGLMSCWREDFLCMKPFCTLFIFNLHPKAGLAFLRPSCLHLAHTTLPPESTLLDCFLEGEGHSIVLDVAPQEKLVGERRPARLPCSEVHEAPNTAESAVGW
ncbi:uncharacterized protein VTP21DRAFT_9943 [Calcarisporiella thermophila]|uniref:uncharacterized protein n=1 Tax=Calcarisporiella thermophila TaxID=911321 RepID=UPI0037443F65